MWKRDYIERRNLILEECGPPYEDATKSTGRRAFLNTKTSYSQEDINYEGLQNRFRWET